MNSETLDLKQALKHYTTSVYWNIKPWCAVMHKVLTAASVMQELIRPF